MTSIRQETLSRIDAGRLDDDLSPPRPHALPMPQSDQFSGGASSPSDPLLATIQNSSAGISAQMSHSVTDARQLLERWTRENILDPQGIKRSHPADDNAASTPAIPSRNADAASVETTKAPLGNALPEFSATVAVKSPFTKSEKPRSAFIPDQAQPDVITRIVTDATKSERPSPPRIELPPPAPRVDKPKSDKTKPVATDTEASKHEDNLPGAIPAPKFADRQRLKALKETSSAPDGDNKRPTSDVPSQPETAAAVKDETLAAKEPHGVEIEDQAADIETSATVNEAAKTVAAAAFSKKPKYRIDASHPSPGDQSLLDMAFSTQVHDELETPQGPQPRGDFFLPKDRSNATRQVHAPHPHLAGAHFDVQAMIRANNEEKLQQSTQSIFGQILAYLGVGVLTLGAGCVLWGYFGAAHYAHLAPTGWLITTAGQMLLFLGVVTLIAGGLEQTNTLVNARLDHWERKWMEFNGHTYRADPPAAQAMGQGPHIPIDAFQDSRSLSETSHSSESRT
ncbi:MAG: hypothetical protein WEB58_13970 [Planctomycetaceae bacterium]